MRYRFRLELLVPVLATIIASGCRDSDGWSCESFLEFTADCYRKVGQNFSLGKVDCQAANMTSVLKEQMECGTKYPDAWCSGIQSQFVKGKESEALPFTACLMERYTKSPCKEAIAVLAKCGLLVHYSAECSDAEQKDSRCVIDHPAAACAVLGSRATAAETKEFFGCGYG